MFVNVPRLNAQDSTTVQKVYRPSRWTSGSKADSAAVDKGVALPNVTDGFAGRARILARDEARQPLPHFGPRNGVPSDRDGRGHDRGSSRFHQLELSTQLGRRQRTHSRAGMMRHPTSWSAVELIPRIPRCYKRLPLSEELVWSTHASNVPSQTNAFSLEALWRAEANTRWCSWRRSSRY